MTRKPFAPCPHAAPPLIASVPTAHGFRWTATCRHCAVSWLGGAGFVPKEDLPDLYLRYVIVHLAERMAAGDAPVSVTNLRVPDDPCVHAPHPWLAATPLCVPNPHSAAEAGLVATQDPMSCGACRALCAGVPG